MHSYQKYLKYKNKYLELKKKIDKQTGGEQPKPVYFSYQGAFAPPHLGHFQCADMFISFLKKRYHGSQINFMFMPTPNTASKSSLSYKNREVNKKDYVSEEDRFNMLEIYAVELRRRHPGVNVNCSTIEFDIGRGMYNAIIPNTGYLSATINTLTVIRNKNPDAIIGVGVGIDNAYEFSNWSMIDQYTSEPVNLNLILMCDREPSDSAPAIARTELAYPIDIGNKDVKQLEAFSTPNIMFFKPKVGLVKEHLDKLVEKMVVLDAPVGFSSSEVRKLMNQYYELSSLGSGTGTASVSSGSVTPESILEKLSSICERDIIGYIITHNIFNPNRTYESEM